MARYREGLAEACGWSGGRVARTAGMRQAGSLQKMCVREKERGCLCGWEGGVETKEKIEVDRDQEKKGSMDMTWEM